MNCCLKSGIHEHSPNSQIHIQIFHRIARLSSIDFPDHGDDGFQKHDMCSAIFGGSAPMSLLYPFDLPGQLKNWLRVLGVAPKLYCFGQQVPP